MSQLISPDEEESATETLREKWQSHTGPECDKCGASINAQDSLVCSKCGWYASINSFIEMDRAWEDDNDEAVQVEKKFSVPNWAWTMTACVVAVVVESIAVRIFTAEGSAERTMWSVTQLFVGMSLAGVCHLTAFVLLMREVSDFGLLDIILKPVKPWILRVNELPAYQWLCHLGASSVVAVLMSLLVIGGIPYEKLLDWGTKKPVKQDLMGAVMDQAKKFNGEEKPLEDAVQDFAGKQDVTDEGSKPKTKPTEPKERQQDDCVIVGYRPTSEGIVYQLILAGENYGKLQYVGQVTPQLSVKELRELTTQLGVHKAHEPFVKMALDPGVVWVEPRMACRVSYSHKGKKGGLFEIKLENMLGEIGPAGTAEEANKKVDE